MLYEELGQVQPPLTEYEPGAIFLRTFDPTEMDKAIRAISEQIERYDFPGWDIVADWDLLGFMKEGTPVLNFLQAYIVAAGSRGYAVTSANRHEFLVAISDEGIPVEKVNIYLDALLDAQASGTLPQVIYEPFTYEPTEAPELGERVVEGLTPGARATLNRVAIIAAIALTAYLAGPPIIKALGGEIRKRKPTKEPATELT